MLSDPPLRPSCGQPASQALAGTGHGRECRNETRAEFGQAVVEHEPARAGPIKGGRPGL